MSIDRSGIKRLLGLLLAFLLFSGSAGAQVFVPTRRDTKPLPERFEVSPPDLSAYQLLYQTAQAAYYWREDRDIIAVVDKAGGYTWKTGADIGFPKGIKEAVQQAKTPEALLLAAEPIEKSMNATYIGVANSLVSIEYRDGKTFYLGSAAEKNVQSTLHPMPGKPEQFVLQVNFQEIDLQLEVQVRFLEKGISYLVPASGIQGKGRAVLTALWLTPFLGASGGEASYYDPGTGDWGEAQPKPRIPGYALVPDGSGALIRFADNSVPFAEYVGDVYGPDPATQTYYAASDSDAMALKSPVMPVYGIAHGRQQAAFVAWAEEGAQHLSIVMRPEENLRLKYNFCYPRFEYNIEYHKVYNRKGSGYFTKAEDLFSYDARMTYIFLHGDGSDGSPAADYAGMAAAYRSYLQEQGLLHPQIPHAADIPLRLDFILSDMKKSLVGHEQVITTTVPQVGQILDQVRNQGITHINSGLIGWQAGAQTLARPDAWTFHGHIGREGDFAKLIKDQAQKGADLSLARDYSLLNRQMTSYLNTAAKHISTWYVSLDRSQLLSGAPASDFAYALPSVAAGWLGSIAERASAFSQSLSVSGITNTLVSSYGRSGLQLGLNQAISGYQDAFRQASGRLKLNLVQPNLYLWPYASRYLQAPVGSSQHVFETDEVPFLQMVLHGCMEVYGPYSNFSFYTKEDVLRMIDYNISPAFILSWEPAHRLADTLSMELYSTEYAQYSQLILDIYHQVNAVGRRTLGYTWVDRQVPLPGLVINSYQRGEDRLQVAINYTQQQQAYRGQQLDALSAYVLPGGGQP